jgi:hypothetical protein
MLDETPDDAVTAADIPAIQDPPAVTVQQPVAGESDTTWLKLHDTVGVSANGNLEPLVDIGIVIAVPQMIEMPDGSQEIGESTQALRVTDAPGLSVFRPARFEKGGRMVETRDARVVESLMRTGNWDIIDRPSKRDVAAHVKALTDATEEAANRSPEER